MAEITQRDLHTNGVKLHIAEAGSGPLVVMVHGWPESWYSWRHQLRALSAAGYHAVAPDVRGYGGSDKPHEIEAYAMSTIVADIAGLVEALGEQSAVVVGHDWGAPIAYHCALLRPERFRAVLGMSVPYTGRPAAPPLETLAKIFADSFFYIDYFQQVGVAEKELEADPWRSLRLILYGASGDAPPAPGFAGKPKGSGLLDGMAYPESCHRGLRRRTSSSTETSSRRQDSAAPSTAIEIWIATGMSSRTCKMHTSSSHARSSPARKTVSSP